MRRKFHFSLSAILSGIGLWQEFGSMPIGGTGQSIQELGRAGYSRLEIAHYFPWTSLNIVFLLIAIILAGYGLGKKRAPQ